MTKKLLPRFMTAENPMAEYGVEYVIHTQQPRFIARFIEGHESSFEIVDEIDDMAAFFKGDVSKIAGLMRRLGDWWVAYCNWEEENHENNGYEEDI